MPIPYDKILHGVLDGKALVDLAKELRPSKEAKPQSPSAREIAKEVLRQQQLERQHIQRKQQSDYEAYIRRIDRQSWDRAMQAREEGDLHWDR